MAPGMAKTPRVTAGRPAEATFIVSRLFTSAECRKIINFCRAFPLEPGRAWNGSKYVVNSAVRRLGAAYIPRTRECDWIYARMDAAFLEAAERWGLDVRKTVEDLKYLVYSKGSHFDNWHRDIGVSYASQRKISMSIELNDSSSYRGGHLQIFPRMRGHVAGEERTPGTAIIFPSDQHHRVTSVTDGTRLALVNWISGPSPKVSGHRKGG